MNCSLEATAASASSIASHERALRLVLTVLFHSLRALGRSRADLVLENVALRQQIAVLTRTRRLPRLQAEERLLWVALRRAWHRWQDALLLVQPETVVGVASESLPALLDHPLASAGPAEAGRGGSQAHRPDGARESDLGCAPHPGLPHGLLPV